ncbi:MAG TPA: rod shape-determining protein [Candidatus Kapabacteria bacterium]|nr:rod shape-determining protein [Candidatus Kapabacteria bacterium]HPO63494.1 rod shape-determining protein [Candidatus Kapabacteria bacterium]
MSFFKLLSNDIAIDLGTANTLIWIKGKGIALNEPSIVAFDVSNKHIIAVGHEAQAMVGRTHRDINIIRPLRDGVIANFEIAEGMMRAFIRKATTSWQAARRIVVCVPSGITEVEKRAVRDSCEHAGAKEVYLIAEPMASAIGVGLNVNESVGNVIVDIGGGTTEIAVITYSRIVQDVSIRVAGDEMTESIVKYFKDKHNFLIGERTAERIKHTVGSAVQLEEEIEVEVKGRDNITGIPKRIQTNSAEVREAIKDTIENIVDAVIKLLDKTPPELAADILDRGIILTGGGANLIGLDELIRRKTRLPVVIAEEPLTAVVRGTGIVVENLNEYSAVLMKSNRY